MAVRSNHFASIANALPKACAQVVKKTALDIQAQAQSRAPVDTGFLRGSIYTVTSDGSSYQGGGKSLPSVATPGDDQTAYAAVAAEYGIYVELGTRYMPGRAYFYPAVDTARAGFESAVAAIQSKLAEASR